MDKQKKVSEQVGEEFSDPESVELWHIFSRVAEHGKKSIGRGLEKIGLRPLDLRALLYISEKGPSTVNALSEELNVSSAWATGLVDELVVRGYVSRERNTIDRRSVIISITGEGKLALSKGLKVYVNIISVALKNLNGEETERFKEILIKIESALSNQNFFR